MIARRIGAVVVAAALIVGAVFTRRALDDDEDAVAGPAPPDPSSAIVCATELEAACLAVATEHPELQLTIEDAGTTLDRLAGPAGAEEVPLWVTIDPFPAMVDILREAAGQAPVGADVTALASTRTAVALASAERADVLLTECAGGALWRCIGDAAGAPWTDLDGSERWGTLRPSIGDVESSASAVASLAAAVAGYFGDDQISRSRWEADPAFVPWLSSLVRAVRVNQLSAGTPLATMVTRRGAFDVAATTDAEATTLDTPGGDFAIQYPEPSMWVEAVLAVPGDATAPDGFAADLTAALTTWAPPEDAVTSLPDAGTMLALRTLWSEAT